MSYEIFLLKKVTVNHFISYIPSFRVETHNSAMEVNGISDSAWSLNTPLVKSDPEVYNIIINEKKRQKAGLEMIASENFTSLPVLECMGSCLNNKYSEGQPGQRYYGGNEYIDQVGC